MERVWYMMRSAVLSRGSKDTLVKYVNVAQLFDSSFDSYSLSGKDKCKVIYFGLEQLTTFHEFLSNKCFSILEAT